MFSLRHLPLCALLSSCSIYDESLLDDEVGRGGTNDGGGADSGEGGRGASLAGRDGDDHGGAGEATAGSLGSAGGSSAGGGSSSAGTGTASGGASGGAGDAGAGAGTSSGAGGTATHPPTGVDLLDDMEDGNFYLFAKPPRFGYWYVAGDATAGATLCSIEQLVSSLNPARQDSTRAVHFQASGFKGWGASVGLTFADAAQKRTPYDSGNAEGIAFWIRGTVSGNSALRVLFPVLGTDPSGAECGGESQGQCLDHFATQISVRDEWQRVTILFADLHQAGWGAPLGGFEPAHLLGVEWTAGTADADVWIDDLALLRP